MFLNFYLEHVVGRAQINQDGLKLNRPHWFLIYADDVSIQCGSVYIIKENTESLSVGSKEMGKEVNDDKTKYMVMS